LEIEGDKREPDKKNLQTVGTAVQNKWKRKKQKPNDQMDQKHLNGMVVVEGKGTAKQSRRKETAANYNGNTFISFRQDNHKQEESSSRITKCEQN
jgi:hypothetical protein